MRTLAILWVCSTPIPLCEVSKTFIALGLNHHLGPSGQIGEMGPQGIYNILIL